VILAHPNIANIGLKAGNGEIVGNSIVNDYQYLPPFGHVLDGKVHPIHCHSKIISVGAKHGKGASLNIFHIVGIQFDKSHGLNPGRRKEVINIQMSSIVKVCFCCWFIGRCNWG
jgi:hypothetical protein